MNIGAFSVSLVVKNIDKSRIFYEKLGLRFLVAINHKIG